MPRRLSTLSRSIAIWGVLLLSACGGGGGSPATPSAGGGGGSPIQIQVIQQQPPSPFIQFPLRTAAANPSAIALGGDSNYWVTEQGIGKIARVSDAGVVTEFPFNNSHSPVYVTPGGAASKYAVWTVDSANAIVSQVTSAGLVREIPLVAGSSPQEAVVDASGNAWVTVAGLPAIAKITTAGAITYYPLPAGSAPFSVAIGPDKNVWFTEPGINSVADVVPGTGAVTQFPVPVGKTPTSISNGGTTYLYFGESTTTGAAYLARMTTSGALTEYLIPGSAAPQFLVGSGPLASTWYVTSAAQLAYDTISKKKNPFTTVGTISATVPIVAGKDGNIWYPDPVNNSADVYVVNPLTATPSTISFTAVTQAQPFSVSEKNFSGSFIATSSNPGVASVSANSGSTFTVTANAAGTATVTVSDNATYPKTGNATLISVTVTTTSIVIN